jgi:AAA+ ATPase superfamily predicted ATPase
MNPFLLNGYFGPEYFCDREQETQTLIGNLTNNSHTAFFAPRRIGKTALIQHVFHLLKRKKIICIYIDIYHTQNLKEFTEEITTAIYNAVPSKTSWGKSILDKIKLLRPVISIDELNGNPQITLDITKKNRIEQTIPQLLQMLDDHSVQLSVAIDEFQQILNYPEKNAEALLRTAIQSLKNIHFIFCGSDQKMMHEIFNNSKRPFYASTKSIHLKKINPEKFIPFIKNHFTKGKMKINENTIHYILELTDNHTYYTQRLCHTLYQHGNKEINHESVHHALNSILIDSEGNFYQYRKLLTEAQWHLLKAIAHEEKIEKPYNKDFIYKYQLGGASGVKRALTSLLEKELIYHEINNDVPYYEVYDKFLMRWLRIK